MFRYLALLWNPYSSEARVSAEHLKTRVLDTLPGWPCCISLSGMSVHCLLSSTDEGSLIALPEQRGAVIGAAFPTCAAPTSNGAQRALAQLSFDEIQLTRGKIITERIWGSYIALFATSDLHTRYVLRAPCSMLACFHTVIREVHVFFSVVDDCLALRQAPFSINWPVIRAQAAQRDFLARETALAEVSAVEAGECVSHNDDTIAKSFFWNPCRISQTRPIERFDEAVGSIRHETLRVVHSWASRYKAIALELSGGLDSSIVLASLKEAPTAPRICPVNLYSTECPVDERRFAQSMAEKTGIPLVTMERASDCDLSIFLRCSRTARPALHFTAPGHVGAINALVHKYGCEAVFDGELGDNVFGNPSTAEPVSDFLLRYGLRPGLLAVARDLARLKRVSIWSALRAGVSLSRSVDWRTSRAALTTASDPTTLGSRCFVTREMLEDCRREARQFVHPWFREEFAATPTAIPLIYALISTTSTSYHAPFRLPDQPPYIRPLVSQPLVEVALRIPGALSIRRGWNRAVARTAFASDLSKEVLLRTTKINFDTWCRLAIQRNSRWLKEFLLDGILARERILDTRRVSILLSDDLTADSALLPYLFVIAYIEGWLRQWI